MEVGQDFHKRPFLAYDGSEVESYKESWHYNVLNEITEYAHGLMSRKIEHIQGATAVSTWGEGEVNMEIHIVTPLDHPKIRVVMFMEEKTIVRVMIAHEFSDCPTIEIPPPALLIAEEIDE